MHRYVKYGLRKWGGVQGDQKKGGPGVRHLGYFGSFDFAPSRQIPVKIKSKFASKLFQFFYRIKEVSSFGTA